MATTQARKTTGKKLHSADKAVRRADKAVRRAVDQAVGA